MIFIKVSTKLVNFRRLLHSDDIVNVVHERCDFRSHFSNLVADIDSVALSHPLIAFDGFVLKVEFGYLLEHPEDLAVQLLLLVRHLHILKRIALAHQAIYQDVSQIGADFWVFEPVFWIGYEILQFFIYFLSDLWILL